MTEDEIVEWHQQLNGVDHANSMSLIKLWETVKYRGAWHAVVHGVAKSQKLLST